MYGVWWLHSKLVVIVVIVLFFSFSLSFDYRVRAHGNCIVYILQSIVYDVSFFRCFVGNRTCNRAFHAAVVRACAYDLFTHTHTYTASVYHNSVHACGGGHLYARVLFDRFYSFCLFVCLLCAFVNMTFCLSYCRTHTVVSALVIVFLVVVAIHFHIIAPSTLYSPGFPCFTRVTYVYILYGWDIISIC